MMENNAVRRDLEIALEVIRNRGWGQGTLYNQVNGRVCLLGGLAIAKGCELNRLTDDNESKEMQFIPNDDPIVYRNDTITYLAHKLRDQFRDDLWIDLDDPDGPADYVWHCNDDVLRDQVQVEQIIEKAIADL